MSGPLAGPRGAALCALALSLLAAAAAAQEEPIGPCSPYRAADGDVPSEMPGCARQRRPAPGSLDDEVSFARGRRRSGAAEAPEDIDDGAPRRPARRR